MNIMTPKEKAKELVDKFDLPSGLMSIERKQCALIAVDEIIKSTPLEPNHVNWDDCGANHEDWYQAQKMEALVFWNEVKQEIEKL